ncbi:hypothetical protein CBS147343_7918 [Aspergillus niger]|nr:hypothetical protein CBS11852_7011 [Aspergillus niger]KAI3064772.1 hypothetical protein CBS147343_7918 [Aspergillus niger]
MAGQQLTWLVTGCSSGLGEALVRAILDKGDKVIATARGSKGVSGTDRLSSLKDAGAAVYELDMASPEEEIKRQAQDIWDKYGPIDVLVNNAGYIDISTFEEMTDDFLLNSLRINALGPFTLTRALLPHMRARKTGTILFSGSVGTYYGVPCGGPYVGPKGLIEGMVPAFAMEVAPFNIRVSILTYGHFLAESGQKRKCQETANTAQDTKRMKQEATEERFEHPRKHRVGSGTAKTLLQQLLDSSDVRARLSTRARVYTLWHWFEDLMMDVSELNPATQAKGNETDSKKADELLLRYCHMCKMLGVALTETALEFRARVKDGEKVCKWSRLSEYGERETLLYLEDVWEPEPRYLAEKGPKRYLRLWRDLAGKEQDWDVVSNWLNRSIMDRMIRRFLNIQLEFEVLGCDILKALSMKGPVEPVSQQELKFVDATLGRNGMLCSKWMDRMHAKTKTAEA